jgi:anti-anti-sigma factor
VHVVEVRGEIDISNIAALKAAVFALPNDALGLVLDLEHATFIDSATIGLLFELRRSLQRCCQALRVVCAPDSPAQRVLELVGFDGDALSNVGPDAAVAAIQQEMPLLG